jgi:hypothetical protein
MIDTEQVLIGLGLEFDILGNEASAICPMHERRTGKSDHNPSWFINLASGQHICFSCGYKGNLVQLVCDVNEFYVKSWGDLVEYDYAAGKVWLSTTAQIPIEKLVEAIKNLPTYLSPAPRPLEMSEARLAVFVDPPEEALASRGITAEAAKAYSLLWDAEKKMWIFPLREAQHATLLGWQEKGTVERTFKNRPAGLQKSKTMFGIENQNADLAIVVESPLDCVRVLSAGQSGAVAICGATVSEEQVKLLRYSDRIVIALDNPAVDAAGKKGCDEFRKFGRKYGLNLFYFNYGDSLKKDVGDLTDEEIRWGIDHAKPSILGELAYVQGNA